LMFLLYTQNEHNFNATIVNNILTAASNIPNFSISTGSNETSGIPPSSLMQFIKYNKDISIKGVVISDHYSSYTNKFYHSIFDDYKNVNATLVCSAATLLSRSLYILANDNYSTDILNTIQANCSLVEQLLYCLTNNQKCPLAVELIPQLNDIQDKEIIPSHYISVYSRNTRNIYQKFIHDWVYNKTSNNKTSTCESDADCQNGMCLKKKCRYSPTSYYDALSLGIKYNTDTEMWDIVNASYPIWTESNWLPLVLRLFQVGNPVTDYYVFGAAVIEVIITIIVVIVSKRIFKDKK